MTVTSENLMPPELDDEDRLGKRRGGRSTAVERIPGNVLAGLFDEEPPHAEVAVRDYGDRYVYRDILGEGGQGIVIRARDDLLQRDVAIKALKKPFDKTRQGYLEREARLCGLLEHPNILPTYDLAHDETGSPFFVMKKIDGVSLEEMLKEDHAERQASGRAADKANELSRLRLLRIFLQVCHGIEFAHSRGVLHLDIKPANVKCGAFGEVYVIDWGFAARMDEEPKFLAGTPIYIAPERFERRAPDVRCDIYSLGVMLYRVLCNRHPREVGRMTFKEYRQRYREIPIIPLRDRDRTISPHLEAIVMKAMDDDPARRYASVGELVADINRFMDMLPVSAYKETPLESAGRWLRKHRRAAAIGAVFLATLAILGAVAWQYRRAELARQAKEAEAEAEARKADHLRRRVELRAKARPLLERAVSLVQENRPAVQKLQDKAGRLERLAPALKLFDQAIETYPEYAEAYYERGKANQLARRLGEALRDYQKAYRLDESMVMAHYYAGSIYADVYRDVEKARHEFDQMREFDIGNEYSDLGKARLALATDRYDLAIELCDSIAARNEDQPLLAEVYYIRGMIHQKSPAHRNLLGAINAYTSYLDNHPDEKASAYGNRADAYAALARQARAEGDAEAAKVYFERALADYQDALAVNPAYGAGLNNLGYMLYKDLGRPEEGKHYLDRLLAEDPRDFWGYMNRGAIYEGLGQPEKAGADYDAALKLKPESHLVHYRLGVFLLGQGRLADSETAFTRAIELMREEPEQDRAIRYHRRGIVRLARGRYADAISDFDTSLRMRSEGMIYPALMRWLALRFDGIPIDREDFERRLEAPKNKPWLAAVGSYFLDEEQTATPEERASLLEVTLAQAPTPEAKCEAHFYIGAHALALGRTQQARHHLQAALDTNVGLYIEHALAGILLQRLEKAEADPAGASIQKTNPSPSQDRTP